jgi:hypothetical protein
MSFEGAQDYDWRGVMLVFHYSNMDTISGIYRALEYMGCLNFILFLLCVHMFGLFQIFFPLCTILHVDITFSYCTSPCYMFCSISHAHAFTLLVHRGGSTLW